MEADKRGLLAVYYLKLTTGLRHTFVMLSLKTGRMARHAPVPWGTTVRDFP